MTTRSVGSVCAGSRAQRATSRTRAVPAWGTESLSSVSMLHVKVDFYTDDYVAYRAEGTLTTEQLEMLYIIGLGLADEKDVSVKGLEIIRRAERVYLEAYTAVLLVDQQQLVRNLTSTTPTFPY